MKLHQLRMMCFAIMTVAALACSPRSSLAGLEPRLAFDAELIGFMYSLDADGFTLEHAEDYEKITGQGSYFPSLRLGLGLDSPAVSYEITVGGALILNKAILVPLASADIFIGLNLLDVLTLGPRAGAFYAPSVNWQGDADDAKFDDALGFRCGMLMMLGKFFDSWALSLSADFVSLELTVQETSIWQPVNNEKLDLSGLALQAGLAYMPRTPPRPPDFTPIPQPSPVIAPEPWKPPSRSAPGVMPSTLHPLPSADTRTAPPHQAPPPQKTISAPEASAPTPATEPPKLVPVPEAPAADAGDDDDDGPDDGADLMP